MENEILVRVAIVAEISAAKCDFCRILGRQQNKAAYSVYDVSICRHHVAKVIDMAGEMLKSLQRDGGPSKTVTSLAESQSKLRIELLARLQSMEFETSESD